MLLHTIRRFETFNMFNKLVFLVLTVVIVIAMAEHGAYKRDYHSGGHAGQGGFGGGRGGQGGYGGEHGGLGSGHSGGHESSAQFWRQPNGFAYPQRQFQRYYPNHHQSRQYQQQNGFQNNMQLPPGVSMSEAEWVCRNPKTGDMMIIAAEEGQTPNSGGNGQNVWQSANISTTEMPSSSEPLNPESTDSNYTDGEGVIDIRLGNKQASKDTNK